MTTLIIVIVIIVCITAVLVVNRIFRWSTPDRDYAARERDIGRAKLFTAQAEILHVESMERRRVLDDHIVLRREQVCDDVRDEKRSS